jgi:hypothetical protein
LIYFFYFKIKQFCFVFIEGTKKEETKPVYRQWKVDDLTDDEDYDEQANGGRTQQSKAKVFEKYIAQRPKCMPPPIIPSQKVNSPRTQTVVDLTDDDDDGDFIQSTPSFSFRPGKKLKST